MMKIASSILVLLLCLSAFSQEADFSGGLLDRQAVLERLAAVSADAFPNSEEVLVSAIQRISYNADGTSVQWHEEYVKILT